MVINLEVFQEDCNEIVLDMRQEIAQILRSSLNSDVQEINNFILGSQAFLQSKPETFDDIDKLKEEHKEIQAKFEEVHKKLLSLDEKVRMMRDLQL